MAVSMPWTMTSLSRLMAKGSYDYEAHPKRKNRLITTKRRQAAQRQVPRQRVLPPQDSVPQPAPTDIKEDTVNDSDDELITDQQMRKRNAEQLRTPNGR